VVTTVAREQTGGLQSTVDDYVVNCRVAVRLGDDASTAQTDDTPDTDTNT
jgi:hypothetical protein